MSLFFPGSRQHTHTTYINPGQLGVAYVLTAFSAPAGKKRKPKNGHSLSFARFGGRPMWFKLEIYVLGLLSFSGAEFRLGPFLCSWIIAKKGGARKGLKLTETWLTLSLKCMSFAVTCGNLRISHNWGCRMSISSMIILSRPLSQTSFSFSFLKILI